MLITETVNIGGNDFIHNYSNANFYIQKVGTSELYVEAYDPIQFKDSRKYIETDQPIEQVEESNFEEDAKLNEEVNS